MRDALKVWGPVAAVSVLALLVAYYFVDPAPPRQLTLATGSPDGAYNQYGQRLRDMLARDGITVKLVSSSGSKENLQLLSRDRGTGGESPRVDLAFVQSGVGKPAEQPYLAALASLYYEPLWVFVHSETAPNRLTELAGLRLVVGPEGSGTRELAMELLKENGIYDGDPAGTALLDLAGNAATEALTTGRVDALFRVSALSGPMFRDLLAQPGIALMSFDRAEAYVSRYRYLSSLKLPAGVLDFAAGIPDRDIMLISPMANLVARDDMHPALVDLVLSASTEIFGTGGVFEEPGRFPSPNFVEFPLSPDAKRYFESGLRFLHRFLPFWAATIIGQLLVMILPIIAIIIPLMRVGPPLYRWQIRHRIVRWYSDLREIEQKLALAAIGPDAGARERQLVALDHLQEQVSQISVPTGYADQLYHLRLHIGFIRQKFAE